ncbi:MAG: type II toxin-antitoxin system VapC family toxin [Hyphomonadaceae bacterium]|nr:type II toxin-antitoxin system VapC family toxin [Hyphomonadaceae bacterium]
MLDASALVALLVDEPVSDLVRSHTANASSIVFLNLCLVETGNALWKLVRRGSLSRAGAIDLLDGARLLADTVEQDHLHAVEALDLAAKLDHPVHDCLYAVAARRIGARLVTCDSAFARKLDADWNIALVQA